MQAFKSLLLMLALSLSACGFHLRGSGESSQLPFSAIYVGGSSPVVEPLQRYVRLSPGTTLMKAPTGAEALIQIEQEKTDKVIRTLSSSGKVLEYELRYSVIYSVHAANGEVLLDSLEVPVRRYLTYSDAELYGKGAEEELLMKDMRNDIAQQIVRRVALYKPTPAQLSSRPAAK